MMSLRVPDSLPLDVGCLPHATLLCGPGFAPRDANEVLARATDAGVLCAALTGCYRWLFRKMSKSMGDLQGLYQAIFCWDSPLHRPYKSFIRSRYLELRILKWLGQTLPKPGKSHGRARFFTWLKPAEFLLEHPIPRAPSSFRVTLIACVNR